MAVVGFPSSVGGWFAVVFYGLGLGVVASGVYKAAEYLLPKKSA